MKRRLRFIIQCVIGGGKSSPFPGKPLAFTLHSFCGLRATPLSGVRQLGLQVRHENVHAFCSLTELGR